MTLRTVCRPGIPEGDEPEKFSTLCGVLIRETLVLDREIATGLEKLL